MMNRLGKLPKNNKMNMPSPLPYVITFLVLGVFYLAWSLKAAWVEIEALKKLCHDLQERTIKESA